MYTTLLVSIIGVCLNVFSGCDKPAAPVYHVGDVITQTVTQPIVTIATTGSQEVFTVTATFKNEFGQDIATSLIYTNEKEAMGNARFMGIIVKMTVSGHVSAITEHGATITDVSVIKMPSTTDKVLGAVSNAYTAVTSAVSATTGHAVTSARNSLANSLIALASKVASK